MKVTCIADEDTVRGFSLAGIAGHKAASPGEAAEALNQALAQPDIGLIILTKPVAAGIRTEIESIRLGKDFPMIVEIPGPAGAMPGLKSLRQSVEEAIGIHFDLKEEGPE